MVRRGQTATEYLIILAVVVVLAIIVVAVLGGFPALGPKGKEQTSQAYWGSTDIGIDDLVIGPEGTVVTVRNNQPEIITITAVSLKGTSFGIEQSTFSIGAVKELASTTHTCSSPGEQFSYEVTITYADSETGADHTFIGEEPFIGTCAEAVDYAWEYDWVMFNYDIQNTGFSPGAAPQDNSSMKTIAISSSAIESQPIIENGVAYVLAVDEMVAYDLKTGKLWNASGGGLTTPILSGNSICYGTSTNVVCRNKQSGALIWEATAVSDLSFEYTEISLAENKLWLGTMSMPALYVYDLTDGTLLYHENVTSHGRISGTAFDGSQVFVIASSWHADLVDVIAYNISTYERIWDVDLRTLDPEQNNGCESDGTPVVHEGVLFVPMLSCEVNYHTLFALNASTGTLLWIGNYTEDIWVDYISPTVASGLVLITGTDAPIVLAYNETTGELVWQGNLSSTTWAMTPVAADGLVFAATDEGVLHALNLTTGEEAWRAELTGSGGSYSPPAIARGKLYIGSESGNLYEFS